MTLAPALPLTLTEAAAALRAGRFSSAELTASLLERADRVDPEIGTYLARFDSSALAAAQRADAELASGIDRGPLHGIPVGVKDIIATSEGPTTAQSLVLDPSFGGGRDAVVVARLREAGAVITGKLTTMEFAIGLPDPSKPFPVPRNPWNPTCWPGGSSSGTGSGIAAGLVYGGLGTDTGGSIRMPASYCGVSGLKATFGRVPKSGCVPLGYSLDNIGPLARSAADCAAMLEVLAGHDPSDPCALRAPVPPYRPALSGELRGLRVGVERTVLERAPSPDPALPAAFDAAASCLRSAGASLVDFTVAEHDRLAAATFTIMFGEAFAYHRPNLAARWGDYGRETRLAISQGALVSAGDLVQAQRARRQLTADLLADMHGLDALILPTTLTGAPPVEGLDFPSLAGSILTPAWNATGFPALSVPMGPSAAGLPLGLQIVGKPLEEATVLRVGDAFQRHTDWHLQVPPEREEVAV